MQAPQLGVSADQIIARSTELAQAQEALASDLNLIASDESRLPIERQRAIEALGRIHSPTAIEALVRNLGVMGAVADLQALTNYPAANPLITFGSAAYPEIWPQLNRSLGHKYIVVLAHVIYRIDGKAVGCFRLRQKLTSPRISPVEKANLEKLLRIVESVDLDDPKNWP